MIEAWRSFNPTLVRLRLLMSGCAAERAERFQSHAGSIEALARILCRGSPASSFNPTLVRLRQQSAIRSRIRSQSFNPTLVRLRPLQEGRHLRGAQASFNPTLVRLRLSICSILCTDKSARFQSHAGSIEAHPRRRSRCEQTIVSIPRWFD